MVTVPELNVQPPVVAITTVSVELAAAATWNVAPYAAPAGAAGLGTQRCCKRGRPAKRSTDRSDRKISGGRFAFSESPSAIDRDDLRCGQAAIENFKFVDPAAPISIRIPEIRRISADVQVGI